MSQRKPTSVCWEIVYWYTFAAMMTILPFHQEFADSGAFTRWERTKWSLRQNLLFMACAGSAGIFGVFVLIASHRLTVDSLLGFAIAASNTTLPPVNSPTVSKRPQGGQSSTCAQHRDGHPRLANQPQRARRHLPLL